MANNGGDSLARGLSKYTFAPAGASVSEERWSEIWADYDPETEKKKQSAEKSDDVK